MDHQLHINSTLSDLELVNASIDTSDYLLAVYDIFGKDKNIPGLILLEDGYFYGLLSKAKFFEVMSKQFMYDIYSKRKVNYFFEEDSSDDYLILNSSTSIIVATHEALKRSEPDIFEPIVVITENNEYRLLDFYQLLVAQNKIQLLMNDLLKQANEFKKEVLAITAHDLRNPIGAILGYSDLMLGNDHIDQTKEFAQYIHTSAAQMLDLVNGFLISSNNDSIEFELEFANFDITDLISYLVKDFEYSAEKKKQKIVFETPNFPIIITSDRLKIKEVLENLLSNAIKYSPEEMLISVSLKKEDYFIEINIKDQGPGFSDSDFKKVFGKFQRLSAQPTANESSTGLGLFTAKKMMDKLNGSIDIVSEPGKGSTFTVKLPLLSVRNDVGL